MDKTQILKLASFIRQGRVILFTGAGFSVGAQAKSGRNLPTAGELSQVLWQIAFPNDQFDGSSLGDVYEAAILQASKETQREMRNLLTVDSGSLDEGYRLWYSFPWHRIYTLNIDDLDSAICRQYSLPRPLLPLSALTDSVPTTDDDDLQVIHLNGTLADLPHVTFSPRQYGERFGSSDLWYDNLARDLKTHPVLYVGTSLDEPPLWTYIEARGLRKTSNETRPGSFLVSPELMRARRVSLSAYNVAWVESSAGEFANDVLLDLSEEAEAGRREIEQRRKLERGGPPIARVSDLQNDSQDDEREFLHGREPRWSDLTEGYAVKRGFDAELAAIYEGSADRLVVITGTAGSGKSTSAMRLALERSAHGDNVFALNPDASSQLYKLRQAISISEIDLLLIDDADRFGRATPAFLQELLDDCPHMRLVVCVRNTRIQALDGLAEMGIPSIEQTVPQLQDTDVDALLDALNSANRLGRLKGKTRKQQRQAMERTYGRQLLVALLEVTQGVRLEQKIESECNDLKGDAPLVYAVAALATYAGGPLTPQELIAASGDASSAMEQIDLLTRRHLLIRTSSGRLMPRHGVIAERVVRYYQEKGAIAKFCTALAIGLASHARVGELQTNRTGRVLIRLLNHEYLIKLVYRNVDTAVDIATLRGIYDAVESVLADDYQYWLQRGSFETEDGDLDLARNFLDQARGMAGSDFNVRTEWSYMMLKRASRDATIVGAADDVAAAFNELEDVISKRGDGNQYAFHIYGSQGLSWARRAPLTHEEKKKLLEQLRRVVAAGLRLHSANESLKDLKKALDREYMMLAVS